MFFISLHHIAVPVQLFLLDRFGRLRLSRCRSYVFVLHLVCCVLLRTSTVASSSRLHQSVFLVAFSATDASTPVSAHCWSGHLLVNPFTFAGILLSLSLPGLHKVKRSPQTSWIPVFILSLCVIRSMRIKNRFNAYPRPMQPHIHVEAAAIACCTAHICLATYVQLSVHVLHRFKILFW